MTVAMAVAVAITLAGACSASSNGDPTARTTAAPTDPHAGAGGEKAYDVGRTEMTFVDRSRDATGNPKGNADTGNRTLETILLYPTDATTDDQPNAGENDPPPIAEGEFPLFVFSHGVTAQASDYLSVVEPIAAAGYVVVLPTFPLTSGAGGWVYMDRVADQAHDVSFLITELLDRSDFAANLPGGHLDPDAVAVGGHSLGAVTSFLFYNSCCLDERVKAVVSIAGRLFPTGDPADHFDDAPGDVPLLLLHGMDDEVVGPQASESLFDLLAGVPRALALFDGADHIAVAGQPLTRPTVIAFLDLALERDAERWRRLGAQVEADDGVHIEVAGGLAAPG